MDEVLPSLSLDVPLPIVFGSREYGLDDETSDVDLCVVGPPAVLERGDDIRALLARRLPERGVFREKILDQRTLQTLKWTEGGRQGTDVSVLLTDEKGAQRALSITSILRQFYAERPAYREVVRFVLTRLRTEKALNEHGVGQAVGQSVKTASAVILCAGLQARSSELRTEADVLGAMAAFDATMWVFEVERSGKAAETGWQGWNCRAKAIDLEHLSWDKVKGESTLGQSSFGAWRWEGTKR